MVAFLKSVTPCYLLAPRLYARLRTNLGSTFDLALSGDWSEHRTIRGLFGWPITDIRTSPKDMFVLLKGPFCLVAPTQAI